jgi:hypothetical protein
VFGISTTTVYHMSVAFLLMLYHKQPLHTDQQTYVVSILLLVIVQLQLHYMIVHCVTATTDAPTTAACYDVCVAFILKNVQLHATTKA